MTKSKATSVAEITEVYGGPTKRFFVSMLTRDIELDDAILDLLDNCVDGAMRGSPSKPYSKCPFKGFWANLTLNEAEFEIKDNCGGIPRDYLENAFSLGRPTVERDVGLPTIGMYGIGMKRAIFKMGKEAVVISQHADANVAVKYTEEWLKPDNEEWTLPVEERPKSKQTAGVTISVTKLKDDISDQLGNDNFINRLAHKIGEHFGYIMQKGFEVYINDIPVAAVTLPLLSSRHSRESAIRPFDYIGKIDNVHVKVTIGLFRGLVKEKEIEDESEAATSYERAGISVVCNDRVVLLHDRSIKTGWGDGGVPRYHPQFRAVAGLVVLFSTDPLKLPISTTKRDLDAGSEVYLKVRQICMEGIKIFTDFTNKWKGIEDEAAEFFVRATKEDARTEIRLAADHGSAIRGDKEAKKFRPVLPMPPNRNPRRRISFLRDVTEIQEVSMYLFQERGQHPSIVGNSSFDHVLKEARNGRGS